MKSIFASLLLLTAFGPAAHAQSQLPEMIIVRTEPMTPSDFTAWSESDQTKYNGTYSGDVGGDSSGSLKFEVKPATDETSSPTASGTFERTSAGLESTVVKFENAYGYDSSEGIFDVGAFTIFFVKMGETSGVVVGNIFFPKE